MIFFSTGCVNQIDLNILNAQTGPRGNFLRCWRHSWKMALRRWTFALLVRNWRHSSILCKQIPTNDLKLLKVSLLMMKVQGIFPKSSVPPSQSLCWLQRARNWNIFLQIIFLVSVGVIRLLTVLDFLSKES